MIIERFDCLIKMTTCPWKRMLRHWARATYKPSPAHVCYFVIAVPRRKWNLTPSSNTASRKWLPILVMMMAIKNRNSSSMRIWTWKSDDCGKSSPMPKKPTSTTLWLWRYGAGSLRFCWQWIRSWRGQRLSGEQCTVWRKCVMTYIYFVYWYLSIYYIIYANKIFIYKCFLCVWVLHRSKN